MPGLIRWQARVNPRLEPRGIARGDGGDDRAYVSRLQAGRPEIIEIGECPQYCDLPRFDRIEARSGPQIPQGPIRDAPKLGGSRGLRPIARISAWIGSPGYPPPSMSHA